MLFTSFFVLKKNGFLAKGCAVLMLLICFIIGCQGQTPSFQPHPRIISLTPSITEILFELNLEKNIVGITNCCNYPAATKNIERVANFSGQANLERILVLKPDIVFSTGLEQAPLVEKLKSLNIEVVLIYPQTLDQLYENILQIGELTQRKKEAKVLVTEMQQKVQRIKERVRLIPDEKRPKVFVEISPDPLMTAGKGSFIDEMIDLAGGKNIAKDTHRPYSQFSPEIVIVRNPDYIIIGYMNAQAPALILHRIGWSDINAVKKGRIIADIHPDLFLRPGPRIVDGLEQMHLKLFPALEN